MRPKAHDGLVSHNHLGKRKTRIHQPIHDEDHKHYKGKILILALHNLSNKIILMLRKNTLFDSVSTVIQTLRMDLQLPMQQIPITINVVSSNPTQGIQHYVIKFVSDLRQVGGIP